LRTSPVSWLGGVACKHPSRIGPETTAEMQWHLLAQGL